jgi:hypothetical protein
MIKEHKYQSPELMVLSVEVEQCFAVSNIENIGGEQNEIPW